MADLTLTRTSCRDHPKKGLTPTRRREVVQWIIDMCKVSVERACRLGNFSRGDSYRKSKAQDQSGLRMRIRDIAMSRPRFGYERIHVLLRREGWHVNLKRVHRLYCLEGLQVRMRVRRKKRMSLHLASTGAYRTRTALEHGFRARSTGQWANLPGSDGRR